MSKPNRLADAPSPYLQQHADNPVDWWPWCDEALAEAKRAGKPILLSVGYAACHWCHVMAHESFEDPATAEVMNQHFINIKVDREERPDIDQIYMAALHATGEQGGWPMTMFLTEDAEPFFGGTYFPKEPRFGRAAFVDVLTAVADAYRNRADAVTGNVAALKERIGERAAPGELPADAVDKAARQLLSLMDPVNGGTRGAPKFPNAQLFALLWRGAARLGDADMRAAVIRSANRIAMGGITDHLGGGFARYAVDDRWLVPHFEKMLYDNAQLIALMSDVWCVTGDPLFEARVLEAIEFCERDLRTDNLWAASLDADTNGVEGLTYVWTRPEVLDVLGDAHGARFCEAYDVTHGGNFEGANVLNRLGADGLGSADEEAFLADCRAKLLTVRDTRPQPARDDKLLADWNGLMIAALARAGTAFRRADWLARADAAFLAAKDAFGSGDRLIHAMRGDHRGSEGFALDLAAMTHAALALVAAGRTEPLADAVRWTDALMRHHLADDGGLYWTADDGPALIMRPHTPADEAVPNANGLTVQNAATLWALTGEARYEALAGGILRAHARVAAQNVFATASLFNGLDQLQRLATVTTAKSSLADAVRRSGHPSAIVLNAPPPDHPGGAPPPGTALVCRAGACSLPLSTERHLSETLWQPA